MTALLLASSTYILTRKTCYNRIYAWSSHSMQIKRLMCSDGSRVSSQGKSVHHIATLWCGLLAAMHSCDHVATAGSRVGEHKHVESCLTASTGGEQCADESAHSICQLKAGSAHPLQRCSLPMQWRARLHTQKQPVSTMPSASVT